jgi:hypothetical protein
MKDYFIIKNSLSKNLCSFLTGYFLLKRRALKTMLEKGYVSNLDTDQGVFGDRQVGKAFSIYGDPAAEVVLQILQKKIENNLGFELTPTYAYTRVYDQGSQLYRHKDRFSCEFSSTLNLGGDVWPIYLDTTGSDNIVSSFIDETGEVTIIKTSAPKGTEIILESGDMLIYPGNKMEHWRNPFEGEYCVQTFLHYNKKTNLNNNIYDGRLHLGLPVGTKNYLK